MKVCLAYKNIKGYRYQLVKDYEINVSGFFPDTRATIPGFVELDDGFLAIAKGYAWDGPSGPVLHTRNWLKPSLVHDALYQMLRSGLISDREKGRAQADDLLLAHLRHEGMSRLRSWYSWKAVRNFGKAAAGEKNRREIVRLCSDAF